MRVAVTGCSSPVGVALLTLLERKIEIEQVVGIDRDPPPAGFAKLLYLMRDTGYPFLDEDLSDNGIDVLVHLAFIRIRPPDMTQAQVFDYNIRGGLNVYRAAIAGGVRKLVLLSGSGVYGSHPDNPVPLTEAHPMRGTGRVYYEHQMRLLEERMDEMSHEFPDKVFTRLRPCLMMDEAESLNALAPDGYWADTGGADPLYWQVVHINDVADAIALAIERDLPGAYNVAPDDWIEVAEICRRHGIEIRHLPLDLAKTAAKIAWEAGRTRLSPEWVETLRFNTVLDNAKLRSTGWRPHYTTSGLLGL